MASANNPFTDQYLPGAFWDAEIATFGTLVTYQPKASPAQACSFKVLWKEGQTDEDMSPGRYSHMDVPNSDLPRLPVAGDLITRGDGRKYEVVRVEALAVRFSVIIVQDVGPL